MGAVVSIARMISAHAMAFWHHLLQCVFSRNSPMENQESEEDEPYIDCIAPKRMARRYDSFDFQLGRRILDDVMKTLSDPNAHIIGVYGSNNQIKDKLLERVERRIVQDNLFAFVLYATVTKKPSVKRIQEDIAGQLGLMFNKKSVSERAIELRNRIKNERQILIICKDLDKGFDLGKVGIPYGADHSECKILLTSTSEEVLSKKMCTQKNFMVD